jgi:hypothetical protein
MTPRLSSKNASRSKARDYISKSISFIRNQVELATETERQSEVFKTWYEEQEKKITEAIKEEERLLASKQKRITNIKAGKPPVDEFEQKRGIRLNDEDE